MELEQALEIADQAMNARLGRPLSLVEKAIFRGAWQGWTYDEIAEKSGYSDSYLRRDAGTKFWKSLGEALGEAVSKKTFRETIHRLADRQTETDRDSNNSSAPNQTDSNRLSSVKAEVPLTDDDPYVLRPPLETNCTEALLQPGALVRVKAPSLMGKTRLVDYVLEQLTEQKLRTANLSLELADRKVHFADLDRFLRWLCINLTRALKLPNELEDYWDEEGMGSKVSCSTYIEEYLLPASDSPLVLCLDDVDLIFPYPDIYEDFFSLLRSWYEMARARNRKIWKKLRLVIVHSTDVYLQLNINQSPFNVGVPIEVPEFSPEQVHILAQQYHFSQSDAVASLTEMVGGHPYLLAQAFEYLNSYPTDALPQLLSNAPTETGIYANHLRDCWLMVRDNPDLLAILKTVMTTQNPISLESIQAHQLHSMGLIKLTGNTAEPRYRLYRDYFTTQLGTLE